MRTNPSKVKAIDPATLRKAALAYLDRFGGTRARVRQTLLKRVRTAEAAQGPTPEAAAWVEAVLDDMQTLGLIDDARFAAARVRRGVRMGRSRRAIAQDLQGAGVARVLADQALAEGLDMRPDPDLAAARSYVSRRGLGHLRADPAPHHARDMARLGRRGFSYETARRALAGEER